MTAPVSEPVAPPSPPGPPGWLCWTGVALVALCGAASAWLESLFVPYYAGDTLLPLTLLATVVLSWTLPRVARALVPSTAAAVLPFLAWLAVIFLMSASGTPEGDVILPGGGTAVEYVGYGVMLGGALVFTLSIVLSLPPPTRRRAEGDDPLTPR